MDPQSDEKGIDALIRTLIENEADFRNAILLKVRSDISPAKLPLLYDDIADALQTLLPAVFRALLTGEGLDEEDITPVRQSAERWASRGVTLRTVGEVGIACAEAAIMMTRVLARKSDLHASADLAVMVSFGRGVMISQQCMTALFAGHARGMLNRRSGRRAADPTVAPVRALPRAVPAGGAAGRPTVTVRGLTPAPPASALPGTARSAAAPSAAAPSGAGPSGAGASAAGASGAASSTAGSLAAGSSAGGSASAVGGVDGAELRQPGADILRMVAEGRTNVEIAAELHLSRQAVNYHVGRLMRALGASNRTALVARAYQRGLLLTG